MSASIQMGTTRGAAVQVAAVDLGSSSGRVVLGGFDGQRLSVREVHRFSHTIRLDPGGSCTWELDVLLAGVHDGLSRAAALIEQGRTAGGTVNGPDAPGGRDRPAPTGPADHRHLAGHVDRPNLAGHVDRPNLAGLASVGVDGWGVDYVLLDADGAVLASPHSYRDPRGIRLAERCYGLVGREESYARTGVEPDPITTAVQLTADLEESPQLCERVCRIALLPDYVTEWLGGTRHTSWSMASTTGLARIDRPEWDDEILRRLGIPAYWLSPIVTEPSVAGYTNGGQETVLVRPGAHDTAAAVHAVPFLPDVPAAFLSCGSWSLLGMERPVPSASAGSLARGITNERGVDGSVLVQKNITGLWLLQECQRYWREQGRARDIDSLLRGAAAEPSTGPLLDIFDPGLTTPGNLPERITELCAREGHIVDRPSRVVRVILESLAAAHARALSDVENATGIRADVLHIVGGGTRNGLLCRLTEHAIGRPVVVGPAEASSIGNLLAQLRALGEIGSADEARQVVRRSLEE